MTLITLKEHEIHTCRQKDVGRLEKQDQKLRNKLQKDILTIREDPVEDKIRFTAHSHIGIAQFSNFAVAITPKFSEIGNLIGLINYVYDFDLEILKESENPFKGEKNLLSEIIIAAFVKKCQHLVRQGLAKSYKIHKDDLSFLRGKLTIPKQVLNHAKVRLQFACEYDELEYDNLENQIILFCLRRCYGVTRNAERRKEINQLVQIFSDLVSFQEIVKEDFGTIIYSQTNAHYKKIHELCELIVNSIQITDIYEQKLRFINSFFVDMNAIFEKFIFKIFDKYYPLLAKQQVSNPSWKSKHSEIIQSIIDILIFEKEANTVHAIIDTKYKDKISNADRYQLEHYIHDYGKKEAYVILPESQTSMSDSYTAIKQGIVIKIRHVNIDKTLDLLNNTDPKKRYQQIKNSLLEIIPCDAEKNHQALNV